VDFYYRIKSESYAAAGIEFRIVVDVDIMLVALVRVFGFSVIGVRSMCSKAVGPEKKL